MALGVARGMAALEENEPPIVHRDLKPTNVFIDAGEQLSYLTQSATLQLIHTWASVVSSTLNVKKQHCSGVVIIKVQSGKSDGRSHSCHLRALHRCEESSCS